MFLTPNNQPLSIGLIGIGGSGMRGLAHLLAQQGHHITGTDSQLETYRHELSSYPFTLIDPTNFQVILPQLDVVIYSDAVSLTSPLRQQAQRLVSTTIPYHHALGTLSANYDTIAIAGTHGKSSTTAIAAHIMIAAGLDPTVLIGAPVPRWQNHHARLGQSQYFLLEADEYRDHFLSLQPNYIVITSIEHDHPDYFTDLKQTVNSYRQFLDRLAPSGQVITLKSLAEQYDTINWPSTTIFADDTQAHDLLVNPPGKHMRLNALLALELAKTVGVTAPTARQSLRNFAGLGRRFERLGQYNNKLTVISDYAHHPTAIKVTLKAAQEKYPGQNILVLFEGHTADRLAAYLTDYVTALTDASKLIITPPYLPPGRGKSTKSARQSLRAIAHQVRKNGTPVDIITNYNQLGSVLNHHLSGYDLVLAFSAGPLDRQLRALLP